MDPLSTASLGVIAFAALVQAAFTIGAFVACRRALRKIDAFWNRVGSRSRELDPGHDLGRPLDRWEERQHVELHAHH